MKKLSGVIAGTMIAILVLTSCSTPSESASRSAVVSEVVNVVEARPASDAPFAPVEMGYTLTEGGQARTDEEARARLDFSDGTFVRMGPGTLVTVAALPVSDSNLLTRIKLTAGKIWIALNGGEMEVETPLLVAAVRGSFAVLEYNPGDPNDPSDDTLTMDCIEGECSAQGGVVNEQFGNLEQVVVTGSGTLQRSPLTGEAVQQFGDVNPEVAQAVVATLTAVPPTMTATDSPKMTATVPPTREVEASKTPISPGDIRLPTRTLAPTQDMMPPVFQPSPTDLRSFPTPTVTQNSPDVLPKVSTSTPTSFIPDGPPIIATSTPSK